MSVFRIFLVSVMAIVLTVSSYVYSTFAISTSDRISEIEEQIRDLDFHIQELEMEKEKTSEYLERLKQFKERTEQYLDSIDETMLYAQSQAQEIKKQIEEMREDIRQAEEELAEIEARVERKQNILAARLRHMYMMGSMPYLELLLSADSIMDFFVRLEYVTFIIQNDKNIVESFKAEKELAEQKKKEIGEQLREVEKKLLLVERMNVLLKEEKVYKKEDVKKAQVQIASMERITEKHEREIVELARKQKELIELKERLELVYKGGIMLYPLEGGQYPLTSGFGKRTDPISGKPNVMHNGIDIGAPRGTNVLAAADGVVLVAGWYGGYGNCVVIDHGDGIWTVYGHMLDDSLKVSVGDRVVAGTIIGQVGTTGKSTGYHLHFEVRKDGEAVDPLPYLGINT